MNSLVNLAGALLMMLAVVGTAYFIARSSKFYRRELAECGNREIALDGLRGLAALMVATYHGAMACRFIVSGEWTETGSPVSELFGSGGVILFFMLTGYLFWNKARKAGGKMNAWKLWRGRLFRIGPLYLFSLLLVVLLAVIRHGGSWLISGHWQPWLRLATLGALDWQSIGKVDLGAYNGVTWTLSYEWGFYLSLPFIAWLAVGRRIFGFAGAAFLLFYNSRILYFLCPWLYLNVSIPIYWMFFILGMLCPVLVENQAVRSRLCHPLAASIVLLLTVLLFCLYRGPLYSLIFAGSLFPLFLVAAAGNGLFGFLTHPAARFLGAISFSLYLLHSIVFRVEMRLIKTAGWDDYPQYCYWPLICVTAVGITFLCAATYRWIEFPFMSVSHKKNAPS
jgi:peptidoglycan/LPS O-acetylase OafA/YrhL